MHWLQDALKYENGKDICGSSIIVEWARGTPRSSQRRVRMSSENILSENGWSLREKSEASVKRNHSNFFIVCCREAAAEGAVTEETLDREKATSGAEALLPLASRCY